MNQKAFYEILNCPLGVDFSFDIENSSYNSSIGALTLIEEQLLQRP